MFKNGFLFNLVLCLAGLAVMFCSWGIIWFYNLDAATISEGKRKAEPIISAIDEYHKKTGKYPLSLFVLTPTYLKEIPDPAWSPRYQYEYHQCTNPQTGLQAFSLSFIPKGDVDGMHSYTSTQHDWEGTDSDYMRIANPCYTDN